MGRRIESAAGHIAAVSAQFLLAAGFLWWSPYCLLSGQILATGVPHRAGHRRLLR
jgi:hypothetical protein